VNGLARASLRFKPASLAGTFVALFLAAVVVMACGTLLQTGVRAEVDPVRYGDVPVVVAADQAARDVVGSGEDAEEIWAPLPELARIDTKLADEIEALPEVAGVIVDAAVSVQSSELSPLTGRDWSTTGITAPGREPLQRGAAPRHGELVIDAATATDEGVSVGDTVTFIGPAATGTYRVAGIAAVHEGSATAWFADGETARLGGFEGRADALAVLAAPGVDTGELRDAVHDAVGDTAKVRSGSGRGEVEQPQLAEAREVLTAIGGSFGGIALLTAVFVVISTGALGVAQRHREIALLRAIGTKPRQIRRMIATEALLVAPLAGAAGVVPGVLLARWWFNQLVDRGAVPDGVALSSGPIPAAVAVGAGLLAALVGGWLAASRPSKIPPTQSLGEAAVERRRPGSVRTALGLAATGGGITMALLSVAAEGEDAAMASLGVVTLLMFGVAMLGPLLARLATAILGLPLRGTAGSLAAANARASSRLLASAITPLVLTIGFGATLLFIGTTVTHKASTDVRHGLVAEAVVRSTGPGLPASTTAAVAALPGVDTAVGVLRSGALYRASGTFLEASATGVTGAPADIAAVLDPAVEDGSLADLAPSTVALDAIVASDADADVGERIELRLGDGAVVTPIVVATYERGLGLGQIMLPRADLAPHVAAAFNSDVLVALDGADAAEVRRAIEGLDIPGIVVTDRQGYQAAVDDDLALNNWGNRVMTGVLGGFAAIAAVNTLVMVVLDRRREVALLRLTGTTRRQVRAMFHWEALLVATTAVVLGGAIAMVTLFGFAHGATGTAPYIPPVQGAAIVVGTLALGMLATAIPARVLLRRAPVDSV
jgi:putative ABC transport system permease protein